MGLGCGLSSKKNLETDGILYVLVEMGLGGALSFKKKSWDGWTTVLRAYLGFSESLVLSHRIFRCQLEVLNIV
jgi:hypothetical protein